MDTLAIAAGTTCLSKADNLRNIRLSSTKITYCVLAVCLACGRTLFVRHGISLNVALL
jgi:hypothetical protein